MHELPDHDEMLLTAQRTIIFLLKTFYLHFSPDWEITQTPPVEETEQQRLNNLLKEKESFLQAGLIILFNSAEIYLKSLIAQKSVFLLLTEIKDSYKDRSFFDCSTIDAKDLDKIASGISGVSFPKRFNNVYDSLRKERNKVIHLGKTNKKTIINDFLSSFITLQEEVNKESLLKLAENLFSSREMTTAEIEYSAKEYTSNLIQIYQTFFPLDEVIKDIYNLDGKPKTWVICQHCNCSHPTLAVISKTKSLCLACGYKNGVS